MKKSTGVTNDIINGFDSFNTIDGADVLHGTAQRTKASHRDAQFLVTSQCNDSVRPSTGHAL